MSRSVRLILLAVATLGWLLAWSSLQAATPAEGPTGSSRFSLVAGQVGVADDRPRRGSCFALRGEPGPDLAGTGVDGSGRWSVQHGFWAATGSARADTLFFHRFEECRP